MTQGMMAPKVMTPEMPMPQMALAQVTDVPRLLAAAVPAVPAPGPAAAPVGVDQWWDVADSVAGQWSGDAGGAAAADLLRAASAADTVDGHAAGVDAATAEGLALIAAAALELAALATEFLAKCAAAATGAMGAGPAAPVLAATDMQAHAVDALSRADGRMSQLDAQLAEPTAALESIAAADAGIPEAPATVPASAGDASGTASVAGNGASGTASGTDSGAGDGAPTPEARAAVRHALSAVGTPYQWGGNTPGVGLDCSGLTHWAYGQAGVDIPRTAAAQTVGRPVDASELLPGDLVVWDGHVAMVVGDGKMVEAGDPVQVNPIRTTNMNMGFLGFYRPTG